MGRGRVLLIGVLIVADLAILFGTPFLETVGDVPRSLGTTFGNFGDDPAAAALPLVRVLLGAVLLAAIVDQIRGYLRSPARRAGPADVTPDPSGWTDVPLRQQPERLLPASMAVRDRWHDLPAWTWDGPRGPRYLQVGGTVWQVDRYDVTVETGIDFDEALRRIEVHDAFRRLADDSADFDRRRAVVVALSAGKHWPFLGRTDFGLATARITADEVSVLDGVFVLRNREFEPGPPPAVPRRGLSYLVAPTTAATLLVESDPDLVVALVDHLDPQPADPQPDPQPDLRDGFELYQQLAAAVARATPDPSAGPLGGMSLSPPSQESVFRIQPADSFHSSRANTRDHRYIVSVAKIDRIYLSTQTPTGIPIGPGFTQVTAQQDRDPPPPAR